MFLCYKLSCDDVVALYDLLVHDGCEEIPLCMASLSFTLVVSKKTSVLLHTLLQEFLDVFPTNLLDSLP